MCPCYEGHSKCDQNCLESSLVEESLFYTIGTNLYYNVTYLYPESNIWIIGECITSLQFSVAAQCYTIWQATRLEAPLLR